MIGSQRALGRDLLGRLDIRKGGYVVGHESPPFTELNSIPWLRGKTFLVILPINEQRKSILNTPSQSIRQSETFDTLSFQVEHSLK
jgi:hypothetical protein